MSKPKSTSKTSTGGKTERQAHRVIHEIWRANPDPAYQRNDARLRLAAAIGVAVLLVCLFVGDRLGMTWLMVVGGVTGLAIFGGALWKASRSYKQDYQRFVVDNLADDGTFMFCPECRARLTNPPDEVAKQNPPKRCPECGASPWRLQRPAEA